MSKETHDIRRVQYGSLLEETPEGLYFEDRRRALRYDPSRHRFHWGFERTLNALQLRKKGFTNQEIGDREGVPARAIANLLQVSNLKRYGLEGHHVRAPHPKRSLRRVTNERNT